MKSVNTMSAKTTHNKDRHIDKILRAGQSHKLTSHDIKLKVNTGSDTCTLTSTDLQKSQLAVKIKPSNCILNKNGGGTIKNYGIARFKVNFLNRLQDNRDTRKSLNSRMQTSAGVGSAQLQQHTESTIHKPTKQTNRNCKARHADETSSTT